MDKVKITCPNCNKSFSVHETLQKILKEKELKYQEEVKVKEKLLEEKYKLKLKLNEKKI